MKPSGIGLFLRRYRHENNLSREAFAEMLDISVAFLAAIELGSKKPAYDTLIKIINTLKVSADEALGTDSYVGKLNNATELSIKLDKLNPLHRDYAEATLKLIVEYFSELE